MASDLKRAQIHVTTTERHALRTGVGATQRFRCVRCDRTLPESEFAVAGDGPRGVIYLSPNCRLCQRQKASEHAKHPLYTPALHRFVTTAVSSLRNGAKARGIAFGIDADDVLGLYLAQGGRCALTGTRMAYTRGSRALAEPTAASVDRKDSRGNYTLDNVHLVCRAINRMKMDLSVEDFGTWCKRVVLHALADGPDPARESATT